MKERRDPSGPLQSDRPEPSVAPAYLQEEDELWEPLNGPHHEAVECDSVWTGILAQLQGRRAAQCGRAVARLGCVLAAELGWWTGCSTPLLHLF